MTERRRSVIDEVASSACERMTCSVNTDKCSELCRRIKIRHFFIQSSLPPKQVIFFDGQIYDAYVFVARLVKKAVKRLR